MKNLITEMQMAQTRKDVHKLVHMKNKKQKNPNTSRYAPDLPLAND